MADQARSFSAPGLQLRRRQMPIPADACFAAQATDMAACIYFACAVAAMQLLLLR